MLSGGPDVTKMAPFHDDPPPRLAAVAPNCLVAAARACHHGVNRSHVIHAAMPGGLLVELFSRDGLGVMISGAHSSTVKFHLSTVTPPYLVRPREPDTDTGYQDTGYRGRLRWAETFRGQIVAPVVKVYRV